MRTILTIAFTILAGPVLAQALPQAPPPDCPPDKACSVAYDENGQRITEHTIAADGYTRIQPGKFAYSLEEATIRYFEDIARYVQEHASEDDPFHPKNMLRDRDGLNADEVQEVIGVALNFEAASRSPKAQAAALADQEARRVARCAAMNAATSPEEQWDAVLADAADELKKEKQKGTALLAQLKPATRAHVLTAVDADRDTATVSRVDMKKMREVKPEAIEEIHAATCKNVQANRE